MTLGNGLSTRRSTASRRPRWDCLLAISFRTRERHLTISSGPPPLPGGGTAEPRTRSSQRCEYQVLSSNAIKGLPDAYATAVERLQPYHWTDGAEHHSLAILRRLSNIDKHRTLIPTPVIRNLEYVGATGNEEIAFGFVSDAPPKHDAPIFGFTVRLIDPTQEMFVGPNASFEEAIEGAPLIRTLEAIRNDVGWIYGGFYGI